MKDIGYPAWALGLISFYSAISYVDEHWGSYVSVIMNVGTALITLLFAIAMISKLARNLARRLWIKALAAVAALAIVLLAPMIVRASHLGMDYIRFFYGRSYYSAIVAEAAADPKEAGFLVFDWGAGGTVLTSFLNALIYDPTDQLMLANRSPAWMAIAETKYPLLFSERCHSTVTPLVGHFYTVKTVC